MSRTSMLCGSLLAGAYLVAPAAVLAEENEESRDAGEPSYLAQAAGQSQPAGQADAPPRSGASSGTVTAGTRFNPSISVILDTVYYNNFSGVVEDPPGFGEGGGDGHGHGEEEGHGHGLESGFQAREAELVFSGAVDPYFDMFVQAAIFDGGIELEEGYVTSRNLPAGLQLKAGHFLSDVGYINKQHIHNWDFVDQPWAIESLFGEEGLRETGLQLSWMPATDSYTRFGVELLNGESEGVASYVGEGEYELTTLQPGPGDSPELVEWHAEKDFEQSSAPRLVTAFAKWAPNLGYDHALQLGLFGGASNAFQRENVHEDGEVETWDGDSRFYGADLVYKYDGQGASGHGDFVFQAEYIRRDLDLLFRHREFADFETLSTVDEADQSWVQDGFYMQGVYGFAPRWNAGLRVDALGLTNETWEEDEPVEFDTSYRYALQTTWAVSEFSRLRAQVNYNTYGEEHGHAGGGHGDEHDDGAWEFMLQYNISLGAHGAHTF